MTTPVSISSSLFSILRRNLRPIGAAVGFGATVAESVSCGKDLRAYADCKSE